MQKNFDIIRKPHLTEKVLFFKDKENKIVFKVDRRANKLTIKNAIEKNFSVKIKKLSIINVKGKPKRQGKYEGSRSDWKKAIVTLAEGNTIEYFEGA